MLHVALYERRIAHFSQKYGLRMNQFMAKKRRNPSQSSYSTSMAREQPTYNFRQQRLTASQDAKFKESERTIGAGEILVTQEMSQEGDLGNWA